MICCVAIGHSHLFVTRFKDKSIAHVTILPHAKHTTSAATSEEVHVIIVAHAQIGEFIALSLRFEGEADCLFRIGGGCKELSAATIGGSALLHRHIVSGGGAQHALVLCADELEFLTVYGQSRLRF